MYSNNFSDHQDVDFDVENITCTSMMLNSDIELFAVVDGIVEIICDETHCEGFDISFDDMTTDCHITIGMYCTVGLHVTCLFLYYLHALFFERNFIIIKKFHR